MEITKQIFALLVLTCFSHFLYAQNLPANDSSEIRLKIDDWDKAWIIKDYKLAAKWYSPDAEFTNAFGDKRTGGKEVEALLKEVFSLPFVMAGKSETTQHNYQVLDNENIIVHTAVIRKGQQMPDGTMLQDRKTTHLRVFQKKNGQWIIQAHLISDARDKQTAKH